MKDPRPWLETRLGRRLTVPEIAEVLGVSRGTATTRLTKHMPADDIIRLANHYRLNPIAALIACDWVTLSTVADALPLQGRPADALSNGELALELARRLTPHDDHAAVDEITALRESKSQSNKQTAPSAPVVPLEHYDAVADGSPDEEEGTPDDYIS